MTRAKAKPKSAGTKVEPNNALTAIAVEGEPDGVSVARAMIKPDFRHGMTMAQVQRPVFGKIAEFPGVGDFADAVALYEKDAANGDLGFASRMLAAQAVTLDNIFTELARRMALNMGESLQATDIYARHAMKAQAQSRATLEALVKIHQPREQTVKHVHVNEGGQAVVADQFHQHTGGAGNGNGAEQCHAAGDTGECPALPGPDPLGHTVPIPGGVGEAALQDARG